MPVLLKKNIKEDFLLKKSAKKIYVLDTNILIQQPNSIFGFDDNIVVVTGTTLQELDHKKTAPGEVGYNAREAIRVIDRLKDEGNYIEGIKFSNGGMFKIEPDGVDKTNLPEGFSIESPDNRIISSTVSLKSKFGKNVILVTNDVSMRVNATICNVEAQGYHNEEVRHKDDAYTGRCNLYISEKLFNKLSLDKIICVDDSFEFYFDAKKVDVIENEFCIIHSASHPQKNTLLGMYKNGMIELIEDDKNRPFEVTGKNSAQKFALHALMKSPEEIPLVIIKGPAGSAKTFLSIAAGLDGAYHQGKYGKGDMYQKVMITRNNVLSDTDIGFLPGTLEEKMGPLVAPFMDNLESLLKGNSEESVFEIKNQIDDLFEDGIIEICSMAYMRGRSITDSFVIIDEAQNASTGQILEIISRAGKGTKIIIAGDPDQIDSPRLDKINNGLVFAAEKMKGSPLCAQITFTKDECVRSPLAMEATKRLSI